MKENTIIADLIREISESGTYEIFQGTVHSIDRKLSTIDVEIDTDVIVFGVRLNVIVDAQTGLILTPKKGSPVLIARIEMGQDYQLIACTELDALKMRIGSKLIEMDADKVFFNEGKLGGLVLLNPLKAELQKIANNQTLLRTALTQLGATLEPLVPGTTALLQGILSGMTPLDLTKLENKNVRQ